MLLAARVRCCYCVLRWYASAATFRSARCLAASAFALLRIDCVCLCCQEEKAKWDAQHPAAMDTTDAEGEGGEAEEEEKGALKARASSLNVPSACPGCVADRYAVCCSLPSTVTSVRSTVRPRLSIHRSPLPDS